MCAPLSCSVSCYPKFPKGTGRGEMPAHNQNAHRLFVQPFPPNWSSYGAPGNKHTARRRGVGRERRKNGILGPAHSITQNSNNRHGARGPQNWAYTVVHRVDKTGEQREKKQIGSRVVFVYHLRKINGSSAEWAARVVSL